jgi:hypothetical protein
VADSRSSEDRQRSFAPTIVPETSLEARLCADPEWPAGAAWGEPRPGHPEGAVAAHILVDVIELHDEAYNAWVKGRHGGKWDAAEARAERLVQRLGPLLGFYLRFYRADNAAGSKDQAPLAWFEQLVARRRDA